MPKLLELSDNQELKNNPQPLTQELLLRYVPPYPDPYIHKLIQPISDLPRSLMLNDLVLCWAENGAPPPEQIRHTVIAKNINDVNCPACKSLWAEGIYGV